MRAVVLCPGPSLARFNPVGFRRKLRGSVVIGVNSVVEQWPVDYWAALDPETFQMFGPAVLEKARERGLMGGGQVQVKLPRVLMMDFGVDRLMDPLAEVGGPMLERFGVTRTDELKAENPPECFADYSTPAALVWAVAMGATSIQVVGADMAGTQDYRGVEGGNRDERRWDEERKTFDRVAAWIRQRGIWFERLQSKARHG